MRRLSDGGAEPRMGAAHATTLAVPPAPKLLLLLLGPAVELGTVGKVAAAAPTGAYLSASLRCGAVGLKEMRLRVLGLDARCSGCCDDWAMDLPREHRHWRHVRR